MLTEMFYTFVITTAAASLLGIIKMCYKSKCSHVRCCGLEIDRNVDDETKLDTQRRPSFVSEKEEMKSNV